MSKVDSHIIGLKTQVKRQVGLNAVKAEQIEYVKSCLVQAWISLYKAGSKDVNFVIWDYIHNNAYSVSKKIDSKELGLKTIINPYTNRDGQTKPAHFTQRGTYYGSIRALGEEPVYYIGWFHIEPSYFKVEITGMEKNVSDFFKPILQV